MSYCSHNEHCPWKIQDSTSGDTIDGAHLWIWDNAYLSYRDVLRMLDHELTGIVNSSGWEEFLRRNFHEYAADVEERIGPYTFNWINMILHDPDYQQKIQDLWHGRMDRLLQKRKRIVSMKEQENDVRRDIKTYRKYVHKCGDWILSASQEEQVESRRDRTLLFSAHTRPVRLTHHEVRNIVWNQEWWRIPGYDPKWKRLLVQRLTDWLVWTDGSLEEGECLPWAVTFKNHKRGPIATMTLTRQSRSVTLSGTEAKNIYYHGGWDCIPGYEAHWQLSLSRILHAWYLRIDPPQSLVRFRRSMDRYQESTPTKNSEK